MAGGAEVILFPEEPFDIDVVARKLRHRHKSYAKFSIVVVAEGAVPAEGSSRDFETKHDSQGAIIAGSIGRKVTKVLENRTGIEARLTVLGHVQRGGAPTPNDRILASRFGVAAVDALSAGKSSVLTALRSEKVVLVPYDEVAGKVRRVSQDLIDTAKALM
jgi:6-phosphofructokinase 1